LFPAMPNCPICKQCWLKFGLMVAAKFAKSTALNTTF
jgi:hypothetical protein